MKILLTGGGTQGHIMPLLVLAQGLKKRGADLLYIGGGFPEKELVKAIKYKKILTGKWRRYFDWRNFVDHIKFVIGVFQSLAILARFDPVFVFAKGGYVSLPVVLAAWVQGIPVYVHESDAVMGFANRLAARFAKKVFVGFPVEHYPQVFQEKLIFSGTPVRREFGKPASVKDKQLFGLDDSLPVLVITGGSQGAQGLNLLVFRSLGEILKQYQVIHLTGHIGFLAVVKLRNRLSSVLQSRYHIYRWLGEDIISAIRASNVVVARGGATTLAEVLAAGRRAVVVPLPSAAGDHQRANAKFYAENFGFRTLEQSGATTEKLMSLIVEVLVDRSPVPAPPNATKKILSELPLQVKE